MTAQLRLKKEEIKETIPPDVPVSFYHGPKKPELPGLFAEKGVLPLKVLAQQTILVARSKNIDFEFLKCVATKPCTPEFGGFNTKIARVNGQGLKPQTRAVYTPLIDMTPSDPTTMKTAMLEAQRLTQTVGQATTVFTADLQLYRVGLNVQWVHPEIFDQDFVLRLGGMHFLMSYVGAVGVLMAGSGLEEIMKSAFGGVPKMLIGKNFPQNVRALRIVVEEILREILCDVNTFDELMRKLKNRSEISRTTKHWVENLITPVLLMMIFIRAEREGEWALHLWAVNEMMPYFFAAGHIHYARYGLIYLRSMHGETLERFLSGEHVQRHNQGLWNGIWTDMFIETTFMRYGHGPGGLIGITLNEKAVCRWALSLHICSRLIKDIVELKDTVSKEVTTHKEEMPSSIKSDDTDRQMIRERLSQCIHPMEASNHPTSLVNIVSGHICSDNINVDSAVSVGKEHMNEYEASWPEGFNQPIKNRVVTMKEDKRKSAAAPVEQFESGLIFARVMVLMNTRDVDLREIISYELAPVPTSMFEEGNGELRIAKAKSTLKKKLQIEQSVRVALPPDAIVIDGCAILWVVHWPSNGSVKYVVANFVKYVTDKLNNSKVNLIFDRYYEYSTKSGTRCARVSQVSKEHKLSLNSPLPPQQVVLTVTKNKTQLIDMICDELLSTVKELNIPSSLILTDKSSTPTEICNGHVLQREDLKTLHEEADVIILQQVVSLAHAGCNRIKVISDDTDVFVLLVHYYAERKLTTTVLMESTSQKRMLVNIGATVAKHRNIASQLLPAHAISGCDTVACYYGIGKAKIVKVLEGGNELNNLGDPSAKIEDITRETTKFIAACYGQKYESGDTMSDIRYRVWVSKTGRNNVSLLPKLKSLPPTTGSFQENIKRAHFQACIWKGALDPEPPNLDPLEFGWEKDELSNSLRAIPLRQNVQVAPPEVLKMIQCSCSSDSPCASLRCGCAAAQLACSVFCKCGGSGDCFNQQTVASNVDDDNDDDDDKDDEHEDNDE